jgi:hypothetical protein
MRNCCYFLTDQPHGQRQNAILSSLSRDRGHDNAILSALFSETCTTLRETADHREQPAATAETAAP